MGAVLGILAVIYIVGTFIWARDKGPGNAPYDDNLGPF